METGEAPLMVLISTVLLSLRAELIFCVSLSSKDIADSIDEHVTLSAIASHYKSFIVWE